jgi:hypothetical protein
LTTIVSEPILDLEGVFADEFLPDSVFFRLENPEGCELGPFSRSAGKGDNSGGRSRGLFELDFDDDFESTGFEEGVFFLDCGESCDDCACCF